MKTEEHILPQDGNQASAKGGGSSLAIWISWGMALGSGVGVALGVAFGNVAIGIALGTSLGLSLGCVAGIVISSRKNGKSDG